jgi:DNA polymerase III alpha subunit
VKDAQRHGLNQPVCVSQSDWRCTVVDDDTVRQFCGNGLRENTLMCSLEQRQAQQFNSLDDFKRRVPPSKDKLRRLAVGALNCFANTARGDVGGGRNIAR